MAFAAAGALLAGSVSVGAVAAPPEKPDPPAEDDSKGSLTIEKKVVNPDGAVLPPGYEFEIKYNCTGGGRGNKGGSVFLEDGESETIGDIPGSKQCAVTEVKPDPIDFFTWGPTFYTQMPVLIDKDNPTGTITVENRITRSVGDLEIAKTINDESEPYLGSGEFPINYSCVPSGEAPGTTVSGVQPVAAGKSEKVKIPTGYECTVTETTFPSVPGFAWSTPNIDVSPTAAINTEEAQMVTVENLLVVAPTPPPTPPTPGPEPAPAAAAATPPPAGAAPEATPVVPETPVTPAPGTGTAPTTPVTSIAPAAGTGVPTSVNAGEGPAPSNGISIAMWLLMIAAISAAVTWGLTRWTDTEGETHMHKVHMD